MPARAKTCLYGPQLNAWNSVSMLFRSWCPNSLQAELTSASATTFIPEWCWVNQIRWMFLPPCRPRRSVALAWCIVGRSDFYGKTNVIAAVIQAAVRTAIFNWRGCRLRRHGRRIWGRWMRQGRVVETDTCAGTWQVTAHFGHVGDVTCLFTKQAASEI